MTRITPYTTTQSTWNTILQKSLRIPMNQREYSWESKEITKFLDDIFKIYEEDKYVEKMGSIIELEYNGSNDIYDGQQRTITTILILYVIGCLSKKLKNKIKELLTVDPDLDKLTQEQEKIKDKCKVTTIPKIYCINPFDMVGLVNIFNDKVTSWIVYLDHPEEIDLIDDEQEYICHKCKVKVSRKSDFIRHITKKHGYQRPESNTKLYAAFIDIYNYFKSKKKDYDEYKFISLYKFITNSIDIQYYKCTDPEYVSRIFDWENNRGKDVETLDIIKNPILVQIPDNKKVEIYERWEKLKHQKNPIYKKNYGQKIFDIAIQLYNNHIARTINLEELFKPIINSRDTYQEINKFFEIVDNLFEIMNKIKDDKFGRLVNNSCLVSLNWEAYMWGLLPIFYKTKNIDTRLIELITKWYFRNLQFKTRTLNNLGYSNELIRISNEVLSNKNFDYHQEIKTCLIKNKDDEISNDNYLRTLETMTLKHTYAKHLLLFLETYYTTNIQEIPLNYTLEHIHCQKDKNKLNNPSLIDNIGNLTLIEGSNSDNGHKGNSSLGSKSYDKKIKSYKGSNCKITREIPEKYDIFKEEHILLRNKHITLLLNQYTNY